VRIFRQNFIFHGASFTTEKCVLYFITYDILIDNCLKYNSLSFCNKRKYYFLICSTFRALIRYINVKWSRYRPGVAQTVGRGIALLFHDRGTRRGEWSAARPGRTLPPGKIRYPFYRRLGRPQGRSWWAENLVLTGIRSRTVQPVVSRYIDWATRSTALIRYMKCINNQQMHFNFMM